MFELPVVVLEFPEMHLQPHSPRWNEVELKPWKTTAEASKSHISWERKDTYNWNSEKYHWKPTAKTIFNIFVLLGKVHLKIYCMELLSVVWYCSMAVLQSESCDIVAESSVKKTRPGCYGSDGDM